MHEITGHIKPQALANAIHAHVPSSWGGTFYITLKNIRDCIAAGDRWFEEEISDGFRIFTDSGFSCVVMNRLAFSSAPLAEEAQILTAWLIDNGLGLPQRD